MRQIALPDQPRPHEPGSKWLDCVREVRHDTTYLHPHPRYFRARNVFERPKFLVP